MAFWCMMITWVMQLAIYKDTTNPAIALNDLFSEPDPWENLSRRVFIMNTIARVWLLSGILLIIKGFIYKENKGLAFKLAFAGLAFMVLLEVSVITMNFLTVG